MPTRKPKITVDLPLYDALWKLDGRIKRRFPGEYPFRNGVDALGVMFVRPRVLRRGKTGGYWCSPANTVALADTGGDGSHFSFLVRESRIDSESPIVLTAPANSGDTNRILARNLQTFLRLGLRRGFFAMEQFGYDPKQALHVYGTPDWQPTESSHYSVGYVPNEREQRVLDFVAAELNLKPYCYTPKSFANLQRRWMPRLQMSADYYEVTGEKP
jgi:hypothetical protein